VSGIMATGNDNALATANQRIQISGIAIGAALSLLTIFSTAMIGVGGCALNHLSVQVGKIQEGQVALAKLESLPVSFSNFETETRAALAKTDDRLDGIAEKVARLEGLPGQVRDAVTEFNQTKGELVSSSADAKVAAATLNAATKEIDALKNSVAKTQERLDHLAELPKAVETTRAMVAQLSKAGSVSPGWRRSFR
jgi:hypothetical protein